MKKVLSFVLVGVIGVVALPGMVSAAEVTVCASGCDYTSLKVASDSVSTGDTIYLNEDITISSVNDIVAITGKEITIEGKDGVTITGYRDDTPKESLGGNHSLITAGENAKIHLKNVSLVDSQKYGVQAYNGGYVSLDNVTINNCRYGAVLINAGTIEIINLNLGSNGENGVNNGIEVSKSVNLESSASQPKLVMNGTISSAVKENVIRFADDDNDATTGFIIENKENSTDKILANGNTVVITDSNNDIKFTSNEVTAPVTGDKYDDPNGETDPTTPTNPDDDKTEVTNPETFDGIIVSVIALVLGLAAVSVCFKKLYTKTMSM